PRRRRPHGRARPPAQGPPAPTGLYPGAPAEPEDPATFDAYVGIDYSGAKTPISRLAGLRVYAADRTSPPREMRPEADPRRHWTRRGVAAWLARRLSAGPPTLGGGDHGFSFPLRCLGARPLPPAWPAFPLDLPPPLPTPRPRGR